MNDSVVVPIFRDEKAKTSNVVIQIDDHLARSVRESRASIRGSSVSRSDLATPEPSSHSALNPDIGPKDKLYASVTSDDWTSREKALYTAAVRLTSQTKNGGRVGRYRSVGASSVTGDLYLVLWRPSWVLRRSRAATVGRGPRIRKSPSFS